MVRESLSGEHAIMLRDLVKSADSFQLGPLNLNLPAGYITAIVGPNGSGKSTLLRLLLNLTKFDRGSIEILQRSYAEHDLELREEIGYMTDNSEIFEEAMTARQMTRFISPFYRNWDQAKYERLLKKFQVDERKPFRKMSKGMIQKYFFVKTLAKSPKLLLLDEPSSGLDPLAWQDMMDEIRLFMEDENHTAVITTHHIEEVRRLADYVVFMHDGQVLGMYEKDQLFQDWKEIWVENTQKELSNIEGVCYIEWMQYTRLIASDFTSVANELRARGIQIYQSKSLSLDEIMRYMILAHDSKKR